MLLYKNVYTIKIKRLSPSAEDVTNNLTIVNESIVSELKN